jgi:hypothetical protein
MSDKEILKQLDLANRTDGETLDLIYLLLEMSREASNNE